MPPKAREFFPSPPGIFPDTGACSWGSQNHSRRSLQRHTCHPDGTSRLLRGSHAPRRSWPRTSSSMSGSLSSATRQRLAVTASDLKHPSAKCRTTLLADPMQRWHYASMSVQITVRDVSENVRDELAARAALQGKSMQEYLRAELERLATRPSIETWLDQVRKRKRASQTRVPSSRILQSRGADRR